jgi:hypothetical protein
VVTGTWTTTIVSLPVYGSPKKSLLGLSKDFILFTAFPEGEAEPGPSGDERRGYPPIPEARKGRERGNYI